MTLDRCKSVNTRRDSRAGIGKAARSIPLKSEDRKPACGVPGGLRAQNQGACGRRCWPHGLVNGRTPLFLRANLKNLVCAAVMRGVGAACVAQSAGVGSRSSSQFAHMPVPREQEID